MTETIKKQILSIRDSGRTNMFQYLANELGYYELVIFLEEHCKEYIRFILTGEQ